MDLAVNLAALRVASAKNSTAAKILLISWWALELEEGILSCSCVKIEALLKNEAAVAALTD